MNRSIGGASERGLLTCHARALSSASECDAKMKELTVRPQSPGRFANSGWRCSSASPVEGR